MHHDGESNARLKELSIRQEPLHWILLSCKFQCSVKLLSAFTLGKDRSLFRRQTNADYLVAAYRSIPGQQHKADLPFPLEALRLVPPQKAHVYREAGSESKLVWVLGQHLLQTTSRCLAAHWTMHIHFYLMFRTGRGWLALIVSDWRYAMDAMLLSVRILHHENLASR